MMLCMLLLGACCCCSAYSQICFSFAGIYWHDEVSDMSIKATVMASEQAAAVVTLPMQATMTAVDDDAIWLKSSSAAGVRIQARLASRCQRRKCV